MCRDSASQTNMFAAFVLLFATSVAALLAHLAIDLAGDVVLARDTYDGLAHGSRNDMLALSAVLMLGAFFAVVWNALTHARAGWRAQHSTFDDVFGRAPWRFVLAVVIFALPALVAMESIDSMWSGGGVDDLTDLLGGSAWLGIGITTPIAACVALGVRYIGGLLLHAQPALVAAFAKIVALLARTGCTGHRQCERTLERFAVVRRALSACRASKRGPPLLRA